VLSVATFTVEALAAAAKLGRGGGLRPDLHDVRVIQPEAGA